LDEVGGVVGGELADPEAVDAVGEVLEEVGLLAAVEFEKELFGAFRGEGLEGVETLVRGEAGPLFEEGFEAEFRHGRRGGGRTFTLAYGCFSLWAGESLLAVVGLLKWCLGNQDGGRWLPLVQAQSPGTLLKRQLGGYEF
jgi:hypothetical protein